MLYGIRDQSPKFCLGSRSAAWNRESQRWDRGSSMGILGSFTGSGIKISLKCGLRDQNYLNIAGSSRQKNTMI